MHAQISQATPQKDSPMLRCDMTFVEQMATATPITANTHVLVLGYELTATATELEALTGANVVLVVDGYTEMMKAQAISPYIQVTQENGMSFIRKPFDVMIADQAAGGNSQMLRFESKLAQDGQLVIYSDGKQCAYSAVLQNYTSRQLAGGVVQYNAALEERFIALPVTLVTKTAVTIALLKELRQAVLLLTELESIEKMDLLMAIEADYLSGKLAPVTMSSSLTVFQKKSEILLPAV